ncbi:hypothetical protein NUSPORA_01073 [Nucleospora cyclopteri]
MIFLNIIIQFTQTTKTNEENFSIKEQDYNIEFGEDINFDVTSNDLKTNENTKLYNNLNLFDDNWNDLIDQVLTEQKIEYNCTNSKNINQCTQQNLNKNEEELNFLQLDLLEDLSFTKTEKYDTLNNTNSALPSLRSDNSLCQYKNNQNDKFMYSLPSTSKNNNTNMATNYISNVEHEKNLNNTEFQKYELIKTKNKCKYEEDLIIQHQKLSNEFETEPESNLNLYQPSIFIENNELIQIIKFNQQSSELLQIMIDLSQKQIDLLSQTPNDINETIFISKHINKLLNIIKNRHQELKNIAKENNKLSTCDLHSLNNTNTMQYNLENLLPSQSIKKEDYCLQNFFNMDPFNAQLQCGKQEITETNTSENFQEIYEKKNTHQTIFSSHDSNGLDSNVCANQTISLQKEPKIINIDEVSLKKIPKMSLENPKKLLNYNIMKADIEKTTDSKNKEVFTNIKVNPCYENDNKKLLVKSQELFVIKHKIKNKLICYGDLSSGEIENDDDYVSEEEEGEFETNSKHFQDPSESKLHQLKPLVLLHESAESFMLLNAEIDFLLQSWMVLLDSENDIKILPEEVSFTPGWYSYKLLDNTMRIFKKKDRFCLKICQAYGLQNYFSLMFNMIRINTYNKKNQNISIFLLLNLVCYHFCSKYNLGNGNNIKINFKSSYSNLINNKNYYRIFKTKKYWLKKAEFLYKKAREKALSELKISQSSFKPFQLYNLLHLIPQKNSSRVAYTSYVYFASNRLELDKNLKFISTGERETIIDKRKKLFKLKNEFKYYIKCANFVFFKKINN